MENEVLENNGKCKAGKLGSEGCNVGIVIKGGEGK